MPETGSAVAVAVVARRLRPFRPIQPYCSERVLANGGCGVVKKLALGCGGLFLLLIVIGVLASGSRPTTTVTPGGTGAPVTNAPQAKVGDKVSSGNWEYTVTKVEKAKTLTYSTIGSGSKVDATGEFVVVSITLKNIGTQNFGINTFDFELQDGASVKYNTSSKFEIFSYIRAQNLTPMGEQVPPGLEVKSALVFDINPAATGLKLVLKQARDTTIALE
jgi:hypothetical protein